MAKPALYRNIHAGDFLDIFLVSAVSSLLLLRFYLYAAGYPQVGSGSLHIAHMLWGGVLMLAAIVLTLSFIGRRVLIISSFVGGIGFGIFIDELGKFITKDNNYFFKPTIGIIYAIFIILYLLFRFLSQRARYTSKEYQLNALLRLEEAVAQDLDPKEKRQVKQFLAQAEPNNVTRALSHLIDTLDTVRPPAPNMLNRLSGRVDTMYRRFLKIRRTNAAVKTVIIALIALFVLGIALTIYANISDIKHILQGQRSYSLSLLVGQIISAAAATALSIIGLVRFAVSHIKSFEFFRLAVLVNLFLTEFFLFIREQFGAMPMFIGNLGLLIVINFVLYQEHRLEHAAPSESHKQVN